MKKAKYHLPLVFLLCLIFILSSLPSDAYPEVNIDYSDKIVHFVLYFILCFCFYYSLINQNKVEKFRDLALLFAVVFTALYGASDEFHQYFVPNRSCSFYDWLADLSGALIALVIIILLSKYYKPFNRLKLRINDSSE